MKVINLSSNINRENFYTTSNGPATISVDKNNVYSLTSLGNETNREAYVRIDLKNLNIGDLITIEYDSDAVGKISEQLRYTDSNNTTKTIETRSRNINGIYYGKSTFVAHKKGDFIISVGASWNHHLDGIIKNITVSVESNSAYTLSESLEFQRLTITTTDTGVFVLRNDWSRSEATLTEYDDETLLLSLSKKPSYRYQLFINSIYSAVSSEYIVRGDVDEYNSVKIKIYNFTTNEIVKLANVKRNLYFGVLLV